MASVEKRGKGWRVRWRDPDGSPHSRSCPTAAAARELKRQVEEASSLGRAWGPEVARRDPELGELINAWLADLKRIDRAQRTILRAWHAAKAFIEWCGLERIAATLGALSFRTLERYDASLAARSLSIASRQTSMWTLGSAWKWGWSHPDWQPLLGMPQVPRMPARKPVLARAGTIHDLDQLVHECRRHANKYRRAEYLYRAAVLMRATGWRVTQALTIDWERDIDLDAMTIACFEGKSRQEKAGRIVPMAPWLKPILIAWGPSTGPVVGCTRNASAAATIMKKRWMATDVDPRVYAGRPDHAFRIALISHFASVGAPYEAGEYYVGHALKGMRPNYVDPIMLPLKQIADLIPPIGPCVPTVSAVAAEEVKAA